jgi:hypothetical protein
MGSVLYVNNFLYVDVYKNVTGTNWNKILPAIFSVDLNTII